MGSGKTTLIKALIEQLSSKDLIHSPSFSLVNEYDTEDGMVYHFDLYRINEPEEIWDIGFEEYLSQDHWLFIEWPELIKAFLPSNFDQIEILTVSETSRSLKLTINKELLTDSNVMSDI
jgi:tRNA threonylcarbamoyladenosine biosynthesis protein TsaE